MARRIDPQLVNRMTAKLEPKIRRAFRQAVSQTSNTAQLSGMVERLKANDIDGALGFVGLDARDLRPISREIGSVFEEGGFATAAAIQAASPAGSRLVIKFDVRNLRSENWIENRSSNLITEIVSDQRVMIRSALNSGMAAGLNPNTVALSLVGRVNRLTGNREGGLIGLTSKMELTLNKYRFALRSSDPSDLRYALSLNLRDRRFDSSIRFAIRSGQSIPLSVQKAMAKQYRNRALKLRGNTIARTEALTALNAAKREAFQQAIDDGQISLSSIKRFAHTAGDERVRLEHSLIPGMNSEGVGMNDSFDTPDGPFLDAPFGINCRCYVEERVDFIREALTAEAA